MSMAHFFMANEKRSVNLPTCRATPAEEAILLHLIDRYGYERIAHFWRRCLTQFIKQNEGTHETESPLRFVEKERSGAPAKRRAKITP
jgi:hypothetical protein